jgi:hypothetical protein
LHTCICIYMWPLPLWNTTCLFLTWYQSGLGSYAHGTHRLHDCRRPPFFPFPNPTVGLLFPRSRLDRSLSAASSGLPTTLRRSPQPSQRPAAAQIDRLGPTLCFPGSVPTGSAAAQIARIGRPPSCLVWIARPPAPGSATCLPDRVASSRSPASWLLVPLEPPGTRHAPICSPRSL